MNNLRWLLLLIILLPVSVFAVPASDEQVRELFKVINFEDSKKQQNEKTLSETKEKLKKTMLEGFQNPSQPQKDLINKKLPEIMNLFRKMFSWENQEKIMIKSFTDTFSKEEIESILAFYKSPTAGYLKKVAVAEAKSVEMSAKLYEEETKKIITDLKTLINDLKKMDEKPFPHTN